MGSMKIKQRVRNTSDSWFYNYFMFLQLMLYYLLCIILGIITLILDKIFRTNRFTNGLSSFFYYLANL